MRVLVIGAAGKTGRAVVERAVKEGHEVTAFVHSDGGYDVPGIEVRAGDAVSGSELDWVITRPAILTEKPATGDVRIFSPGDRDKAHSITRSDLAAFLVAQLTSDDHLRQAVTIANRLSPSRSTPGQKRAAELRGASGISNRTPRTPGQSRHLIGAAPRTGV